MESVIVPSSKVDVSVTNISFADAHNAVIGDNINTSDPLRVSSSAITVDIDTLYTIHRTYVMFNLTSLMTNGPINVSSIRLDINVTSIDGDNNLYFYYCGDSALSGTLTDFSRINSSTLTNNTFINTGSNQIIINQIFDYNSLYNNPYIVIGLITKDDYNNNYIVDSIIDLSIDSLVVNYTNIYTHKIMSISAASISKLNNISRLSISKIDGV